ncbi:type II toxin-antitoxin system mRNA interferase toxin, RelE/StbE family [Carnobacterium maltaromaticum]|uniref:type II toxin-antitoxin system mRNA interferase toxin, RelE/StbE family n=1 Tax=Carnobacterium maltaromaticum TaxID=2751 RepID=UPI00295E7780|nr:type II toxin-antitoxin system mRNA interferase toxin, RelE/StbE family [Carnobacterium maltaromaticum]
MLLTSNQDELKIKYKDYALKGNWQGYRELYLEKNWLLIYKISMNKFILTMIRTGTHDEIL